jgi:hypothetical protein
MNEDDAKDRGWQKVGIDRAGAFAWDSASNRYIDLDRKLDEVGEAGWELVAAHQFSNQGTNWKVSYVFKRLRQ